MEQMHGMFDYWANHVVHLWQLKSSLASVWSCNKNDQGILFVAWSKRNANWDLKYYEIFFHFQLRLLQRFKIYDKLEL